MATVLKAVFSLAPYHIMAYGTLLGTELYQVRFPFFKPIQGVQVSVQIADKHDVELRDDQNLLSGTAHGAVHDPSKAGISGILSHPSRAGRTHCGHISDAERAITGPSRLGVLGAVGDEFRFGGTQLARIRTEYTRCDGEEDSSRLVPCIRSVISLFLSDMCCFVCFRNHRWPEVQ
jgi:hypothetical protein